MCFVPSRTLDDPDEYELLTCGLDGTLRLWSILTEVCLGMWASGTAACWDMSTYRMWDPESQCIVTYVALACEDGTVRIYVLNGTDLHLIAVLRTPHTHRLLSVTFGHSQHAQLQNNHFSAPFIQTQTSLQLSASTPQYNVQLWACSQRGHVYGWYIPFLTPETSSNSLVHHTPNTHFMLPHVRKERPLGWALRSYSTTSRISSHENNNNTDDRLVVADSSGRLTVWDTRTATLLSTLLPPLSSSSSSHPSQFKGPDLLTLFLQSTPSTLTIYTAGVDPQIVQWTWDKSQDTWHYTRKWSPHSHDIRVLQLLGQTSDDVDRSHTRSSDDTGCFLLSAGVDCTLALSQLAKDPPTVYRVYPFSHHPSHFYHIAHRSSSSTTSRYDILLAVQQQRCLEFWGLHCCQHHNTVSLSSSSSMSSSTSSFELVSPRLLLKLTPKVRFLCISISSPLLLIFSLHCVSY